MSPYSQAPLLYAAAIVVPAIILAARFTPVRATPRQARQAAAINLLAVVIVVAAFLQLQRIMPVGWAAFAVLLPFGAWIVASMFIFGVSKKPWHRDDR
jgi:hypothetical protein